MPNFRAADDARISAAHRAGILAGIIQLAKDMTDGFNPRAPLVVRAHDSPRRMVAMAAREGFGNGCGVTVPFLETLDIDPAEFPLLEGILLAVEKAAELLGTANIEPDFEEMDTLVDDHPLEIRDLGKEMLALRVGAKAEHFFHNRAVIPTAVIEYDLAPGGQMVDVALEIPLRCLDIRRFAKGDNPRAARIQILA